MEALGPRGQQLDTPVWNALNLSLLFDIPVVWTGAMMGPRSKNLIVAKANLFSHQLKPLLSSFSIYKSLVCGEHGLYCTSWAGCYPTQQAQTNPDKAQTQRTHRSISHANSSRAFKGSVLNESIAETATNDFLTTNSCCWNGWPSCWLDEVKMGKRWGKKATVCNTTHQLPNWLNAPMVLCFLYFQPKFPQSSTLQQQSGCRSAGEESTQMSGCCKHVKTVYHTSAWVCDVGA